jgi:hypothetical protein
VDIIYSSCGGNVPILAMAKLEEAAVVTGMLLDS